MGDAQQRLLLTGLVVVAMLAAVGLMWRGWRSRATRQEDLPAPSTEPLPGTDSGPATEPASGADVRVGPVDGRYLATTSHGDWLDRIVVHGLGAPSRASVSVRDDGVLVERSGARDLFVPVADLDDARLGKGIAGAVYEEGGLLVMSWRLGDRTLDSGFRADRPDDHDALVAAVVDLVGPRPTTHEGPTTQKGSAA